MTREVARISAEVPVDEVMAIIKRDGGVIIEQLLPREIAEQLDREVLPQLDAMDYGSKDEKEVLDDFLANAPSG